VAAELEARWNAALQKTCELEHKLQEFDLGIKNMSLPRPATTRLRSSASTHHCDLAGSRPTSASE
jgi:hypothetical protein